MLNPHDCVAVEKLRMTQGSLPPPCHELAQLGAVSGHRTTAVLENVGTSRKAKGSRLWDSSGEAPPPPNRHGLCAAESACVAKDACSQVLRIIRLQAIRRRRLFFNQEGASSVVVFV